MVASPTKSLARPIRLQKLLKPKPPLPASYDVPLTPSCTPLHTAILRNDMKAAHAYIRYLDSTDADGNTPLHHACVAGRSEMAALLVERGASVNVTNDGGNTPLHKAAVGGHVACVELLLAHRANVLHKNHKGQYAADLAGWRMHTTVTARLRDLDLAAVLAIAPDAAGNTRLHYAAASNKVDALLRILAEGTPHIEARNENGCTALHLAAQAGHYDILQYLVDAGADVFAVTNDGACAFDLAATHLRLRNQLTRIETAKLATLEQHSEQGDTVLHVLAKLGRLDDVQSLLHASPAAMTDTNAQGDTALHVAAQYNRVDVLRAILAHDDGACLFRCNHKGQTARATAPVASFSAKLLRDAEHAQLGCFVTEWLLESMVHRVTARDSTVLDFVYAVRPHSRLFASP
ncbi:hypothetical protein SDRG_13598 [Saprolegnia diclina VS20]|uniref:Uncharacterized protein n=1 Tax=Saprolegnia diclina (strain VS20) TaxID=1156394 RepID=T0PT80_SAPDV|nr:hypothetical protein SDRG_13598 [Saprolegnia diclina VS20]EQC28724.1 hypothetical protein SDRG_13598 [Saprolegnia diclina VS20]|eukprot:XP_008617916.1 hypothetical protein SDRG_13598 [Saprolegnia diclina VS20]